MRQQPKILILAGSIRSGSFSQQLADAYAARLAAMPCEITRITLSDYPLPIMDEDLQKERGLPESAIKLARQFDHHTALMIVTPEYNGSLPPLLKNAIDWVSRVKADGDRPLSPYRGKLGTIASSSNGALGGISAITHLRQILTRLGVLLVTEQLALAKAASAFDRDGNLAGERDAGLLDAACRSLVEKATLLG
ncbi:MAG: NAD(P)H-dependent oxidoreductase [Nitratireductor sp.]|nr:NAD(P)H-dependent oxidoreductase [Nitratireductor sp.]